MKVELGQGETVSVGFAESDGEIRVSFGSRAITVESDLPDSSGRQGVIYAEVYGEGIPKVEGEENLHLSAVVVQRDRPLVQDLAPAEAGAPLSTVLDQSEVRQRTDRLLYSKDVEIARLRDERDEARELIAFLVHPASTTTTMRGFLKGGQKLVEKWKSEGWEPRGP